MDKRPWQHGSQIEAHVSSLNTTFFWMVSMLVTWSLERILQANSPKKKQITQRCWFQYLALYSCCSACPCILVWLRIIMFQLPSERFCCAAWTPISYRKCPTNEAICSEFDKLNEDNEGKSWKIHRNPPWTKWESSAHQLARCLGLS